MSQFIKKLKELTEREAKPLGFAPASRTKAAPILLVGQLPQGQLEKLESAILKNLNALLISSRDAQAVSEALSRLEVQQLSWGVWLQGTGSEDLEKLAKLGCEFVVFGPETPAELLEEERIGRVLSVEPSLTDSLAQATGKLSIDAITLSEEVKPPLTIGQLVSYRRLLDLIGKPSMFSFTEEIGAKELEILCEVGFRAAVVDLGGKDSEKLTHLQRLVQSLKLPKRKGERSSAVLPRVRLPEGFPEEEI